METSCDWNDLIRKIASKWIFHIPGELLMKWLHGDNC